MQNIRAKVDYLYNLGAEEDFLKKTICKENDKTYLTI